MNSSPLNVPHDGAAGLDPDFRLLMVGRVIQRVNEGGPGRTACGLPPCVMSSCVSRNEVGISRLKWASGCTEAPA